MRFARWFFVSAFLLFAPFSGRVQAQFFPVQQYAIAGFPMLFASNTAPHDIVIMPKATPQKVEIAITKRNANGTILEARIITPFTYAYYGYTVSVVSGTYDGDARGFLVNGTVQGPGFEFTLQNARLNGAGWGVPGQLSNPNGNIVIQGWTVQGPNLAIAGNSLAVSGTVVLPNSMGSIEVAALFQSGTVPALKIIRPPVISVSGYSIRNVSAAIVNNAVSVSGMVGLPNGMGNIAFQNLVVTPGGTITQPSIAPNSTVRLLNLGLQLSRVQFLPPGISLAGTLHLSSAAMQLPVNNLLLYANGNIDPSVSIGTGAVLPTAPFPLTVDSAVIKNNTLVLGGTMLLSGGLGEIRVGNIPLTSSGACSSGAIELDNRSIRYQGFSLQPTSGFVDFINGKIVLAGNVLFPEFGTAYVENVEIGSTGIMKQGTFVVDPQRTYAYKSYVVNLQSIEMPKAAGGFAPLGLTAVGRMMINGVSNNLQTEFSLTPSGTAVQKITPSGIVIVNGFPLNGTSASFGADNQLHLSGDLTLPRAGVIPLADVTVSGGGILTGEKFNLSRAAIQFFTMPVRTTAAAFNGRAVTLSGEIPISAVGTLRFAGANIQSDGSFADGTVTAPEGITLLGFPASLTNAYIAKNGIGLTGVMAVGKEKNAFAFHDIVVNHSGIVSIGGFNVLKADVPFHGFPTVVTDIALNNGTIWADGLITLPDNLGTIKVKQTRIVPDGTASGGTVDGAGIVLNYGGSKLAVASAVLGNNTLTINGTITLPAGGGTTPLTGLVVSPAGIVNNGAISAPVTTTTMKLGGYTLNVSSLVPTPQGMEVSGTFRLPNGISLNGSKILVGADGIPSGGTISFGRTSQTGKGGFDPLNPAYDLTVAGFGVKVKSVVMENNAFEFDGSASLPNGGSVEFNSVDITPQGTLTGGTITYQGPPLKFAGGTLSLSGIALSGFGITASALFTLPNNLAVVQAKNVTLAPDGRITVGSLEAGNATVNYNGYVIALSSLAVSENGITVNGSVTVPKLNTLAVANLSINPEGSFNGGTITPKQKTIAVGSASLTVNRIGFASGSISVDGVIQLPNKFGTVAVQSMTVNSSGHIVDGKIAVAGPLKVSFAGMAMSLTSARFEGDEIELDGSIALPNNLGTMTVRGFEARFDGSVNPGTLEYSGTALTVGGFGVTVNHASFASPAGITLSAAVKLPQKVSGTVAVNNVRIGPDGSVSVGAVTVSNVSASVGTMNATLTSAAYANGAFAFNGVIHLPGQYGTVSVAGLSIQKDGTVTGGTLSLQGATVTHNGFAVNNLTGSLTKGMVTINGSITLPSNLGTVTLTGLTLNGSGVVSPGSAVLKGTSLTWRNYAVTVDSLSVEPGYISVDGKMSMGKLVTLTAEGLQISTTGTFAGGKIVLQGNSSFRYNGFQFALTEAVIQNDEVELSGSVTLPGNRGTVSANDVNISYDGTLNGGSLTYDGPPFAYNGYSLSLKSLTFVAGGVQGTATFALGASSGSATVTLSSSGSFAVTNFNLQNVKLTYAGFAINNVSVTTVGDSMFYSGSITVPNVGDFTVTDMTVLTSGTVVSPGKIEFRGKTFAWGKYTVTVSDIAFAQNAISIDGSIAFPGNYGSVNVTGLTVSTTGALLGGTLNAQNVNLAYKGYSLAVQSIQFEGDGLELNAAFSVPNINGTFAVHNFEVGLDGTVNFGTVAYTGQGISFDGFSLSNISVTTKDLTDIALNGTITFPPAIGGSAVITGLSFGTSGNVGIKSISVQGAGFSYKGFAVTVDSVSYADQRMNVSGTLTLPQGYGNLKLTGLQFDAQGNFYGGTVAAQGTAMSYKGFTLTLDNASIGTDDVMSLSGSIRLPNSLGTLQLTGFTMKGTSIVNLGQAALTGTTLQWKNYTVTVDTLELLNNSVLIDGSVKMGSMGTVRAEGLQIGTDGSYFGGTISFGGLDSLKVGGFVVNIINVSASGADIEVDGSITLPGSYGTIQLKGVDIRTDGSAFGGLLTYNGPGLSFNGAKLTVTGLSIVNNGISVSANLLLPDNIATLTANNVTLSYPMQITVGSIGVSGVSFTRNGFTFTLASALYQKSDLVVSGSVAAPLIGKASFTNLTITTAGELTGGTVSYSNAWQWGKVAVAVKNISYDWSSKTVALSGSVGLPDSIGTIDITSLVIDASAGTVKQAAVALEGTLSYGGRGLKDPSASFANNQIEIGGTVVLDAQRSLTVSGVDIDVQSGTVSGGTIVFNGPPFSFGGLAVTVNSVSIVKKKFSITATVTLPGSMGVAAVQNAAFAPDGSFSVSSVTFSGQHLSYKGFGFLVKSGTITKDKVSIDVTVTLAGDVSFGINGLQYSTADGFHGGTLDFSQTKISYKGYSVSISASADAGKSGYTVSGHFALPESKGTAAINGIDVSSTGVSFANAKIDWSSLPNLLPKGFTLNITDAEFVADGFEVSGTVALDPFFDLTAKNLIVTSKKVEVTDLHFDVGQLKVGTWSFGGLSFDFRDTLGTFRISMDGSIKLAGKIEGFTLKGSVSGNKDFSADLTASLAILLGETGAELIQAEGGFTKQGNDYQIKLGGTFAPVGMQNFVSATGDLIIDLRGVITGTLDVNLFSSFTIAKSTMVIDIPAEKFTIDGSLGVKRIILFTGHLEVDAKPFQINGRGDVSVAGYDLAQSTLLIDTKQFSMQGSIDIPNPSGGNPLVDFNGHITMIPSNSYVDASGELSLDGYKVASTTFRMSPDTLYGKGSMHFAFGDADFEFLALGNGNQYRHGDINGPNAYDVNNSDGNQSGSDYDYAVDMAMDVLQTDYPTIYNDLVQAQTGFRMAKSYYNSSQLDQLLDSYAKTIAAEVIAAVNIAGIDQSEFKSSIVTFLESRNMETPDAEQSPHFRSAPSYGYQDPGMPPYTTTQYNRLTAGPAPLLVHLTGENGEEYDVPFSALQLDASASDARETTIDITPAFSDVVLPVENSDQPLTVKGDDRFWEMLEMSAAMPPSGTTYKLQYFKCDVEISFKGMTFDKTTIMISQGTFQGSTTVHVPGIGSGVVTFRGDKSGVTYFTGSFDIAVAGFSIASAGVTYTYSGGAVTITANGSAIYAGITFAANVSLSDSKSGGFSINSFTLKGAIGLHAKFHFDFHWKCFHVKFNKTINVNFATATFSYTGTSIDGDVEFSIPFPWPIHTKHISFGVEISPHELDICFDLFGKHCAPIPY